LTQIDYTTGTNTSEFLDARNQTNERYATAANTAYDARGNDSANSIRGMRST